MDELISIEIIACTLLSLGAVQASFFAIATLRQRQYYLALWLVLFTVEISSKVLLNFGIWPSISQWFGFWITFDVVYGPLLFLWVLRLTSKQGLSRWHILHFVPAMLFWCLLLPQVWDFDANEKAQAISDFANHGQWVSFTPEVMHLQSLMLWYPTLYTLLALAYLFYWQAKKQTQPSLRLGWLKCMLGLHVLMWCAVIFGLVYIPLPPVLLYMVSYLPTVFWINLVAYLSLIFLKQLAIGHDTRSQSASHVSLTQSHNLAEITTRDASTAAQDLDSHPSQSTLSESQPVVGEILRRPMKTQQEKYQHNKLSRQQQSSIAELIEQQMAAGLFRQSRLTLPQLAKEVDLPSHYISQVINDYYQCNFFDYVNRHRLAAIKKQLQSHQAGQITILEIAIANGFNSKSTFNTAFKKDTGLTPSQFRKQALAKVVMS
ncbi:helix-turn-helix domain-containing protein [Motilimonas pumila]|uniref:AraC family transcriptional regulator n=1 Tax=Motilimonas pumila TaxID=2303987 RepID=A0A418YDL3_9GAMM|nr:AraC family transcriptional regulator [Motilimonas pumila]RJG42625.1 AraC family transcriptional regulator [Motilimonas pumila]